MLLKTLKGRIILSFIALLFVWLILIYFLATLYIGWNVSAKLVILYSLIHASYIIPIAWIIQFVIYKSLSIFCKSKLAVLISSIIIVFITMMLYHLSGSYLGIGGWIILVLYGIVWNEIFWWLVNFKEVKE